MFNLVKPEKIDIPVVSYNILNPAKLLLQNIDPLPPKMGYNILLLQVIMLKPPPIFDSHWRGVQIVMAAKY